MATYTGTTGNDSWNLITPGTFTLDGLAGVDTLNLGTSLRSSYTITQATDGSVHIDSISGASGALHATLYNMEILTFKSGTDVLDLRTYFGAKVPPTVAITDTVVGTAIGNVTYNLAFSAAVTGLTASDFTVSNGSVVSVSGSGTAYSVIVAPSANVEGTMGLTLNTAAARARPHIRFWFRPRRAAPPICGTAARWPRMPPSTSPTRAGRSARASAPGGG